MKKLYWLALWLFTASVVYGATAGPGVNPVRSNYHPDGTTITAVWRAMLGKWLS